MSMQQIVMKSPALTRAFMGHASASFHERNGERFRRQAVRTAVEQTIAYPKFLIEHGVDPRRALRPEAFETLPLTNKADYVDHYPLTERCRGGRLDGAYLIEKSSGHSGSSYYWPRSAEEDVLVPSYIDYAFRSWYGVETKSTLVIVALALGTWIAGMKMTFALRQVAASGKYRLTVISPGPNLEEVLEIVRDISPYYEQTVLNAYPPFARAVIEEGADRGIDWQSLNLRLGLGGEGFSEEWRRYIGGRIGVDVTRDLLAVSSAFGAADLGMIVGREYPLTVLVRQLCQDDRRLANDLFDGAVPNLFQFSPSSIYAEQIDGEVVFTNMSGLPVIRYRINDRGGVARFEHVMQVLDDHGYDPLERLRASGFSKGDVWRMPFFWVNGRSDGTIQVNGANVYDENIETVLSEVGGGEIVGHKAGKTSDRGRRQPRLLVLLEHRDPDLTREQRLALAARYRDELERGLVRVNADYAVMHAADPLIAQPIVRVYGRGRGPFLDERGKIKKDYSLR